MRKKQIKGQVYKQLKRSLICCSFCSSEMRICYTGSTWVVRIMGKNYLRFLQRPRWLAGNLRGTVMLVTMTNCQ